MPTPQVTLRVDKGRLRRWKDACIVRDTSLSEQVRLLMDGWTDDVLADNDRQVESGDSGQSSGV